MTRLSVSRPTWSVPSRLCASGGLFIRRKSALSGSRGASSGAASATKMMARPTKPPMADSVLRREKRASSTSSALITGSPRTLVACGARSQTRLASRLRLALRAVLRLARPLPVPDTRIEPRIAEVDQHVDDDEDHRVEQHEVLHDDDV